MGPGSIDIFKIHFGHFCRCVISQFNHCCSINLLFFFAEEDFNFVNVFLIVMRPSLSIELIVTVIFERNDAQNNFEDKREQHDYIEKQLSLLTSEIKEKIRQMREEVEVKVYLSLRDKHNFMALNTPQVSNFTNLEWQYFLIH